MQNLKDKLRSRGADSLSDAELLALVMEEGTERYSAEELAVRMLESMPLADMARADTGRLRMLCGAGLSRAERIVAAAELGRRMASAEASDTVAIRSSEDVVRMFRADVAALSHEECHVLYLTSSGRVIERRRVSQGGVQATVVDYRIIVKRALELLATQIILVHNHPSGKAEPSADDRTLTERLAMAAGLFDIKLLDHIIVSSTGASFSFRSAGLLK